VRNQHGRDRDRTASIRYPDYAVWCAGICEDHRHSGRDRGDLVEATQDCGAFVQLFRVLKRVA